MTRSLFARGAQGIIICSLQTQLRARGHYTALLDGDFGPRTEHAVQRFQQEAGLEVTGRIDDTTWSRLMDGPIPSIFESR